MQINKISNIIDEREFRKIERYAKKIGVSPYMLFISAFFILLYKYTGQEEIILGTPYANRDINETKRMIGMFVNNIVVKANINSEETTQQFLNKMKEQGLDKSVKPSNKTFFSNCIFSSIVFLSKYIHIVSE